MKSRGSSFTAFEDEYDPDLDLKLGDKGHVKLDSSIENAQEKVALAAHASPRSREADAMQPAASAAAGCKHRRTTR